MADVARFWETWAPYLSYFEDNHLDLANIKKLDGLISDPVLIVGGGQGLLVEQLQKSGHKVDGVELSPQMIKYAQIRRGLKLIEADARKLPFPDRTYNTSIIATGVVDFLDDDAQIGLIVNEARRVTQASGKVLVGFVGVYPAAERFCRRIGLFKNQGTLNQRTLNQRKVFELTRLSPFETLKIFRRDYQLGVFAALRELLVLQMFLPRKEKKLTKKLAQMWKVVDNPQDLINSAIESLPYRTEDEIRALFSRLRLPVVKLIGFGNCYVVQIGSIVQEVARG
jgi:cyclopropane fatty-acyl-phospholipid synthase-like methyltransferase